MKIQYLKYQKMKFRIQLYIDTWEIIIYLQANPYRIKTEDLRSPFHRVIV